MIIPITYNIQHNDGGDHGRQDRPNGGMYVNETDTALTVETTDLTCIAFTERSRKEGRTFESQEEIAYALANPGSGGRTHSRMIAIGCNNFGERDIEDAPLIAFDPFMAGSNRTFIHRKNSKAQLSGREDAVAGSFGVRRLTPVECERLQGFPDGWTEGQSDSVRYRQLGNAVAVPIAEWIGRRLMNAMR